LARYLLDRPVTVAGRRVLDVASDSGRVAIAAGLAGAAAVTANDIDPYALAAIGLFLHRVAARGAQVLVGDPGRGHLPQDRMKIVASYPAPAAAAADRAPDQPDKRAPTVVTSRYSVSPEHRQPRAAAGIRSARHSLRRHPTLPRRVCPGVRIDVAGS
jgi:predicted nicotinamide N-methyase